MSDLIPHFLHHDQLVLNYKSDKLSKWVSDVRLSNFVQNVVTIERMKWLLK